MSLNLIQSTAESAGISLSTDGTTIVVDGPTDQVNELAPLIRKWKPELIQILQGRTVGIGNPYADWDDHELSELLQERIAIMQHDGGIDPVQAEQSAVKWLESEIGEKRFHRFVSNAQSRVDATQDTPQKTESQNSNVASFPTNGKTKWLPDAQTPDSLSTQLARS